MCPVQTLVPLSVEAILAGFSVFDRTYKRAEVDAALAEREAIVPRLIQVLEGVLAAPEQVAADENAYAHVYALQLLGHFREASAHPVIVALASLPGELPFDLFGDTITEGLDVILLRTCAGSFTSIQGLMQNRAANDYCRGAATCAYTYGVAEGGVLRTDALAFFGELLDGAADDPSRIFYGNLGCCIIDIYPAGLMEKVEAACAAGLISSDWVGLDHFHEALEQGEEACLARLRTRLERESIDDMHGSMSRWACFQPAPVQRGPAQPAQPAKPAQPVVCRGPSSQTRKAQKKRTKASQRRNRQKKR